MSTVLTFIIIVSLCYFAGCDIYRRVHNDNTALLFAIVENTVAVIVCCYLLRIL